MKSKEFSPLSLEITLEYAKAAREYARRKIYKSYTSVVHFPDQQLENNYQKYLYTGIQEIRGLIGDSQEKSNMENTLVKLPELILFEYSVSMSSKYSLGNCREYAMQALDFVIHQLNSCVFAELFSIKNGNHNVLVLNRLPDSDPAKPETWGDNAVVCDPWGNKVYKATEYREGLKDCVDNFDPAIHQFTLWKGYNSLRFATENTVRYIKRNFSNEVDELLNISQKYVDNLTKETARIINKYGNIDPRVSVLENKIHNVNESIQHLNKTKKMYSERKYATYNEAKLDLTNNFNLLKYNSINSMQFSRQEQDILNKPQGSNLNQQAMKFFGKKSDTYSNLEKMTKEVNEYLLKIK